MKFIVCIFIGTICYDDACHLKRFSQNPTRSTKTPLAVKLSKMEMLCDKFHFRNHTDTWCKKNCNPLTSESLQVVVYYKRCFIALQNKEWRTILTS